MKKIGFILATCLLGLTLTGNALPGKQHPRMTPEQRAARTVERMNQELRLTEKQQEDLKTWFTTSFKKQQEEMQKNKANRPDREAMRERFKKSHEATDAELKKVLTKEQYQKYKENEAKKQQEREQHRGGRR